MSTRERDFRAVSSIPGSDWNEKREAATELAEHGWPVLRGTYCLSERGSWLGKRGTATLEPISVLWAADATTDPTVAGEWWSQRPYSVLLACGGPVDALELDAKHGEHVMSLLHEAGAMCPTVITPSDTWVLFVSAGRPLRAELAHRDDITLRGEGCWLPLPPTSRQGVQCVWRVAPSEIAWHVPESAAVQEVLARLDLSVVC